MNKKRNPQRFGSVANRLTTAKRVFACYKMVKGLVKVFTNTSLRKSNFRQTQARPFSAAVKAVCG